jgi:hypothetical protein
MHCFRMHFWVGPLGIGGYSHLAGWVSIHRPAPALHLRACLTACNIYIVTRQARRSGTARTYPESEGSSMTCSIRVALRDSHGVSIIHLTNPPPEHRTIFSRASTESQATKPSRRWQPLRVTSITGLQLDHLVPLNATS